MPRSLTASNIRSIIGGVLIAGAAVGFVASLLIYVTGDDATGFLGMMAAFAIGTSGVGVLAIRVEDDALNRQPENQSLSPRS